jgi:hypothetical protein
MSAIGYVGGLTEYQHRSEAALANGLQEFVVKS